MKKLIEKIYEDTNGILHLKISNPPGEKELLSCIPLIENHLVSGKGYVLQVGDVIQLSAVIAEPNQHGIMGQIKIHSITTKETFIASVLIATIDGTPETILDIHRRIRHGSTILEPKLPSKK
jgi:hypothetical protein